MNDEDLQYELKQAVHTLASILRIIQSKHIKAIADFADTRSTDYMLLPDTAELIQVGLEQYESLKPHLK